MGRNIWAPVQGTSDLSTSPTLSVEIICLKKLQHLFSQINFFWVSQVLGRKVCLLKWFYINPKGRCLWGNPEMTYVCSFHLYIEKLKFWVDWNNWNNYIFSHAILTLILVRRAFEKILNIILPLRKTWDIWKSLLGLQSIRSHGYVTHCSHPLILPVLNRNCLGDSWGNKKIGFFLGSS